MKVLKISQEEIKEYEKFKIYSELVYLEEKIKFFEKKYKMSFKNFEKKMKKQRREKFLWWDDYLEWKAYETKEKELKNKIKEIDAVQNIKIT